jgi:hypothetical protein
MKKVTLTLAAILLSVSVFAKNTATQSAASKMPFWQIENAIFQSKEINDLLTKENVTVIDFEYLLTRNTSSGPAYFKMKFQRNSKQQCEFYVAVDLVSLEAYSVSLISCEK